MYSTIESFLEDWKGESNATRTILKALTDESLTCKVGDDGRTIGRLAWHIASCVGEVATAAGLNVTGCDGKAPIPTEASEIARLYDEAANDVVRAISDSWTDATLDEEKDMYGERWKNSKTLSVLIKHEIHHRAQLTVIMRLAGLKVPGIYGPAREEWAAYGMPAQP